MIKLERMEYRTITERAELTLDDKALSELTNYIRQEYVPVNPTDEIPFLTEEIITAACNDEPLDSNCNVRYRTDTSDTEGASLSIIIMNEIDDMFADGDEVEYTTVDSDYDGDTPVVVSDRD